MAELKTFRYTPTNWIDGRTAVTAARLNNIENALISLQDIINEQQVYIQALETRLAATIAEQVAEAQATITSNVNSDVESKFTIASAEWSDMRDRLQENQEAIRDELKAEAQVFYEGHASEYTAIANRLADSVVQINRNNDALTSRCTALENGQSTVSSWISAQEDTTDPNSWRSQIQRTLTLAQEASTKSDSAVNKSTAAENAATAAKNNADLQALFADNNFNARVVALLAQNNVATKTDVATEIGKETSARVAAIAAEATARTNDITNATSGLIRGENFNTLLSAAATGLGFAKTADVDKKIIDAETAINKATNQKLGTAFGLTVNDDDDVDMTALQTQLQNFAGSTLLTANIITDTTEGNQTLTQWLNNKQTVENTNFTDIANRLTQLANDITDIKNKLNTHATNVNAHSATSGGLFDNVTGYDGPIYSPIGGFTPNISFNDKNTSNNP